MRPAGLGGRGVDGGQPRLAAARPRTASRRGPGRGASRIAHEAGRRDERGRARRSRQVGTTAASGQDRSGPFRHRVSRLGRRPGAPGGAEAASRDRAVGRDHPGRPAAGARPAPERRHRPWRGSPRRPGRPVDGVRRRPHARARRGDARCDRSAGSRADRGRFVPRGRRGAQSRARTPRYQGAQCHARRKRTHRADGLRGRRNPQGAVGAGPAGTPLDLRPSCSTARPPRSRATSTAWVSCCSTWSRRGIPSRARRWNRSLPRMHDGNGIIWPGCGPSCRTASRPSWNARSSATRPAAIAAATKCSGTWWRWCTSWAHRRSSASHRPIGEDGLGGRPAFADLGPDRDLEYLASGLADELLTGLEKVPGLRLVSRSSTAHAARDNTDIRLLCRRLGVDAAIEGTVRNQGIGYNHGATGERA